MHTFTYIAVREADLCANCSHASKTSCCCLLLLLLPIPLAFLAILRANSWLTTLMTSSSICEHFFLLHTFISHANNHSAHDWPLEGDNVTKAVRERSSPHMPLW